MVVSARSDASFRPRSAAPLITIYCSIQTTKRDTIESAEDAPPALEKMDAGAEAVNALVERDKDGTSLVARQGPGPCTLKHSSTLNTGFPVGRC